MPPERATREALQPPPAPAPERPLAHIKQLGEDLHPPGRRAVLEGGSEHHDRAEIDVTAQETDRRRRVALATALDGTAKADTSVVLL